MRLGKLLAVYRSNRAYSAGTAGLFNKTQLQNPSDWVTYAQDAIRRYCSMSLKPAKRALAVSQIALNPHSNLVADVNPLLSRQ